MSAAIELDGVGLTYEDADAPALEGISLGIDPGECVGVVGPNDAGKTTLVRALNGLIPFAHRGILKGSVRVFGRETRDLRPADLAAEVGLVFSDPEAQFTSTRVEEEILFGLENLGLRVEEIGARLEWVREAMALGPLFERSPYELSGGQKQRVAIAAVVAMKPRVLVLDEPTSMLDPVAKREVFELLAGIRRAGDTTLVIVEHHLEALVEVADRLVHLQGGRVKTDAPAARFFAQHDFDDSGIYPPEVAQIFAARRRGEGPVPCRFGEAVAAWSDDARDT